MAPVLVTGAAGGLQGSTGRLVVELLRSRGEDVRAFVHSDDGRAAALRDLGAEVVAGDLRDLADVWPAVRGTRRAFFTYPVTAGLLDATGPLAAAARAEGLDRVVEVSMLAAAPDAGTPRMRQHWVCEQVFDRAGVGAVHLRAGVFFENLTVLVAIGEWRELRLPLGSRDTVIPLVAASDVARVAAGLLRSPDPADRPVAGGVWTEERSDEGRRRREGHGPARAERAPTTSVCRLVGEVLTIGEVADVFGVTYVEVSDEEWRRQALAVGYDPHAVEHLTKLWELFRTIGSGHPLYQVTGSIADIGGEPPVRLREHVRSLAAA